MRVGIIAIQHESNTFVETPTTLDDFRRLVGNAGMREDQVEEILPEIDRVVQLRFLRHEPDSCGLARHALSSRAFSDYY